MARRLFALGVFTMASGCGVIGYQILTYHFYGHWPSVSFGFVFGALFGAFPVLAWHWGNAVLSALGRLPVSAIAIVLSYALFLLSDVMRGKDQRQSS